MKKIYYGNTNQKKTRVALLISDKVDFRTRISARDKEGHFIIIQGVSSTRGHNNPKDYVLNKIYEANIGRTARGKRQMHNYSWRFQYTSLNN